MWTSSEGYVEGDLPPGGRAIAPDESSDTVRDDILAARVLNQNGTVLHDCRCGDRFHDGSAFARKWRLVVNRTGHDIYQHGDSHIPTDTGDLGLRKKLVQLRRNPVMRRGRARLATLCQLLTLGPWAGLTETAAGLPR